MENLIKFTQAQLFEEWLKSCSYQKLLAELNVIAVGLEGFEILVQLKFAYPHLRVGYFYHSSLNKFLDMNGDDISENFMFIPIDVRIINLSGEAYHIQFLNRDIIHQTLKYISNEALIIGSMTDPILVRLLEFYKFNHRNLLIRRPMYFETSSLRGSINKFLQFSPHPEYIRIIDSIRINRWMKKLGYKPTMLQLHDEIYGHWFVHLKTLLDLPDLELWDEPRVKVQAGLY
ncbi:MAG: hypothetical protein ACI35V_07830 [Sphingobacterium composti]|uniref:hypothetical protein n=1 Tax=Sphingobacterium composti TaxID=363260 RepID=UPI00135BD724|nr:hypothetical protein [Sphingobacterium composti Ten et al. 2007 non Yoo et al. 2007]